MSCEVQFVTAEIKRNNITLPRTATTTASNATHAPEINKTNVYRAKPAKGERKSEVYVVNNGLLLLHPQKVITSSGVKKSTEPVPPPSINYHVIRKLRNNGTEANAAPNLLENHLRKRSLSIRFRRRRKNHSKHNSNIGDAAKRLGIPIVYHGRILSVNRSDRLGKKSHRILSFFNRSKNRSYRDKTSKKDYNDNLSNAARRNHIRGSIDFTHTQNKKRTGIENPLFDNDQEEYLQLVKYQQPNEGQQSVKRTKKTRRKGVAPIKKIPDIKKYFEKPLELHEYPRFAVKPFPGREFPRFPISSSALSTYPRFPLSPQHTQILHRFPIRKAALAAYPRYPYIHTVIEFPRFENGLKRFTEYPRFEEIKPLNLDEYPRFPEPTPIPEIKDIGDAEKRGKSKRDEIAHREGYLINEYENIRKLSYNDDDDDNDDDDGDEDDETYNRSMGAYVGQGYPLITPIGSISHIESPPGIPEIADIPFLPEIPPLHGIHGIKPISPIKSIPQSDKTGTSRSLPTEAKDIARIQSNNVSIKDLSNN